MKMNLFVLIRLCLGSKLDENLPGECVERLLNEIYRIESFASITSSGDELSESRNASDKEDSPVSLIFQILKWIFENKYTPSKHYWEDTSIFERSLSKSVRQYILSQPSEVLRDILLTQEFYDRNGYLEKISISSSSDVKAKLSNLVFVLLSDSQIPINESIYDELIKGFRLLSCFLGHKMNKDEIAVLQRRFKKVNCDEGYSAIETMKSYKSEFIECLEISKKITDCFTYLNNNDELANSEDPSIEPEIEIAEISPNNADAEKFSRCVLLKGTIQKNSYIGMKEITICSELGATFVKLFDFFSPYIEDIAEFKIRIDFKDQESKSHDNGILHLFSGRFIESFEKIILRGNRSEDDKFHKITESDATKIGRTRSFEISRYNLDSDLSCLSNALGLEEFSVSNCRFNSDDVVLHAPVENKDFILMMSINSALKSLTTFGLSSLKLKHCRMKRFPTLIGFENLTSLDLSGNMIKSISIQEIGQIGSIKELNLSNNAFQGQIPFWMLQELTTLNFSENFDKAALKCILHAPKLKKLDLEFCKIDSFPDALIDNVWRRIPVSWRHYLPGYFSGSRVKDVLLGITELNISGNMLEKISGKYLESIEILEISSNDCSKQIEFEDSFFSLKHLTDLKIGASSIKNIDDFISKIQNLVSLKNIDGMSKNSFRKEQ